MDDPESPCNDICRLNPANICIGCGRTMAEIADWPQADADRRRDICRAARERKSALGDLY